MGWLIALVVWSLGCSMAAEYIACQKRRPSAEGFLLGIILGPIGALVIAMLPDGPPEPGQESDPPSPQAPHAKSPRRPAPKSGTDEVVVDPSRWR